MNKARDFEDFILDDYDYNQLEDWDLEYLWEWVEFDDFSDLQDDFSGGYDFDPDGDDNYEEDEEEPNDNNSDDDNHDDFLRSLGLLTDDDEEEQDNNNSSDDDEDADFLKSIGVLTDDDEEEQGNNNASDDDDEDADFLKSIGVLTDDDEEEQGNNNNLSDDDDEDADFLKSIGVLTDDDEEEQGNNNLSDDDDDFDDDEDYLPDEMRFIETSAGQFDALNDDILFELQKLEFEEFIDVLKNHNHLFDIILKQRNWSDEELQFLNSIEPLVRDPEKLEMVKQQAEREKDSESQKPLSNNKLIATRRFDSVLEMIKFLSEVIKTQEKQTSKKHRYLPKNMADQWNIDSEEKRITRIGKVFGKSTLNLKKDSELLIGHTSENKNYLAGQITGKNEVRLKELVDIVSNEIRSMVENLDANAIQDILGDGEKFGKQFTNYLLNKYGSKILYLLQSQLKYSYSMDRLSEIMGYIITTYLQPKDVDSYLVAFFEGLMDVLDENNIDF